MRLDGDDAMALCYIGEAHEQLNEFELAKHFYRKSLELAPMLAEAWLGLGIIEDLEGKTKEGIILIQKALEIDPLNAGIFHVLAGAYEKIDEKELAIDHYEKSLELDPSDVDCLSDYISFLTENSPIDAFRKLQVFNSENDSNPISKLLEVNLYWILGQRDNAKRLFIDCLQEDEKKAKSIFEINPDLLDDQDFLNLSHD
jgi:tetratricopeptide (TPR) repeat protein